jgi:hypothetical protein
MKLTLTLILMLALFKGCGETKDINVALDSLGIPSSAAAFKHDYRTAGGVTIRSTQELPQVALHAIDEGISIQIAKINAARPTWQNHNRLDQYYVLVIDPTAYSQIDLPGAPLIQMRSGTTAWPSEPHPRMSVLAGRGTSAATIGVAVVTSARRSGLPQSAGHPPS